MSGLMSDQQKKRLREDFLYCFVVVVVVSSGLRTLENPSSSRLSNTIRDDALLDVTADRPTAISRGGRFGFERRCRLGLIVAIV